MPDVEIKKYKNEKAYKKDAKKMAEQGYMVADVKEQKPGFGKKLMVGALLAKSKYLVTYQRP